MDQDLVLHPRLWHTAVVLVVVGMAVPAAYPVSHASAQKTRPEKLWDAYPLDPGDKGGEPADPAPTPTAVPERGTGSPARPAASDDGGGDIVVPVLMAFAVGLGAGVALHRRRRRRANAPPIAPRAERALPEPVVVAPPPAGFLPPVAARGDPPAAERRFARAGPWPKEAKSAWTCEIDWKPGYIRSGFRAMVAPPGEQRRRPFGQSRPLRWTLMDDPEPPTEEMVAVVQELVAALTQHGWVRIGPAGRWYAQRFLWAGEGQPRPLEPLTGKEADV
jgi:hypothetical protein